MKYYRLKKEATPFFKEDLATRVEMNDVWERLNVDKNALEEVLPAFLQYGHCTASKEKDGYSSSSLSGWSKDEGKYFHFTIHFPSVKFMESDKFGKGRVVRELMDRIQYDVDNFYKQFLNEINNPT